MSRSDLLDLAVRRISTPWQRQQIIECGPSDWPATIRFIRLEFSILLLTRTREAE